VNQILGFSLENLSLREKLQKSIETLCTSTWLKLQDKGGVFLADDKELNLVANHNLGPMISKLCNKVEKGKCHCGKAFETAQLQFSDCLDEKHEITFDGISPHGHYNVPIIHAKKVIGVIVLYLEHGHIKKQREIEFLKSVSEIFSNIIVRHRYFEDLKIARKEAIAANKSKDIFLASMSHEIRTPLNGVIATAELLCETKLNSEQKDFVKTIQSCGNSLLDLINDILVLSRIESGAIEVYNREIITKDFFEQIGSIFRTGALKNELNFSIEIDPSFPSSFKSDEIKLKQIIINLLGNANKFTEKGSIKVLAYKKGEQLFFEVEDSGIGMTPSQQKRLFKPFVQADFEVAKKYGGTGLGLVICKKLTFFLNGDIEVKSKKGQGTKFTFWVEYNKSDELIKTVKKQANETSLSSLRILLAEDNEVNQMVCRKLIEKLGMQCELAENGQKALELVQKNKYDFILMDMNMPIMDGIEAAKAIRKLDIKQPTIIALTANAFETDKKQCLKAGMDDFLSKPLRKVELLTLLEKHFKSKKVA
jgi:signal transduction histidine kinase/ActR/RegA family two-component response regulator